MRLFRRPQKVWSAVRRNPDGSVDDVAVTCDTFRLEQMDTDSWWAAAYRGDKGVMFSLRWDKKKKEIVCTCYEDSIGCVDDSVQP